MKKYLFAFLLLFVFLFSIDKVYAVNIDTYDGEPKEAYVYLGNNAYLTSATQSTFQGLNYWYVGDPNPVQEMRFVYDIVPSDKAYDVTFQVFGTDTRGITPYIVNNSCQTFASGITVNSNDPLYDRQLSNYYNVYCYNIPGGTSLDILFRIDWSVSPTAHRLGVGRFYFTDSLTSISSSFNDLQNEQKETNQKLDEANKQAKETNDYLKDDDTSGANSEAESFFSGFTTDTHGLTSIITAPLELIGNIAGSKCSPLQVPLPYVNTNLTLPCMGTIYKQYFGNLFSVYQVITFGFVAYWVCVRIFALVKDFKNPDHDEIEVMDL
ncbi:MAG: hypothetical protein U0M66_04615 [Bacilli bacterium]|nr:hypothetical protein [Bacilli bacterium]